VNEKAAAMLREMISLRFSIPHDCAQKETSISFLIVRSPFRNYFFDAGCAIPDRLAGRALISKPA
jgi:hypothetical protein